MHFYFAILCLVLPRRFASASTSFEHLEINLEKFQQSRDDFEKYWPIFDQFLVCTIHFSRTLNSWMDMQDSFLARCRILGYCTTLQTSYFEPVGRDDSILLHTWNQTGFEQLSNKFWSIFLVHRFHTLCTLQLNFSYYDPVKMIEGDPWFFFSVSPHKSYIILPCHEGRMI